MTDIEKRLAALSPEKRKLLLRQLNQELSTQKSDAQQILPQSRETSVFPLSFSQQRLWFLDQLEPGNVAYNIPIEIRLKGMLHITALEKSLSEIVRRHESLRTTFVAVDGKPMQVIHPPKPINLPRVDVASVPKPEQEIEVERLISEEALRPFDLTQGPLLRTTLLKLSETENLFLITMHHIISDAWSMNIFIQELGTLYETSCKEQPSLLQELSIQYADFAQWQRDWLQGERLDTQLNYWRQQLGGDLPQLDMLLDKPRPPVQSLNSAKATLLLSASLSQSLRRLSQKEESTLFMTLLAAFKLLLQRCTGLEDIVVGSPIAGRNRAELENLIGFFINTLVLRTDLSGNPSFRELIQRVRKTAMDAYTNQDIPFEKLLIELHPERDLNRTPLYQVFFNMLNLEEGRAELPGLSAEIFDTPDIGSKFDLTMYLMEKEQAIKLVLVYNTDLFTRERMTEILNQYHFLLTQITTHPNAKIMDYSFVTDQARAILPDPTQELISTWQGAVHRTFSDQASRVPDQIAILDNLEAWSYRELDHLSNQLANFLRAHDVQSQEVVAIYAHRSASLVWALLGILKAGAAFVILDPAYPHQRLIDYLQIAKPKGWLQLEAAGQLPKALQEYVESLSYRCHLELPSVKAQADALLQNYPPDAPELTVGPDDLAYIAFTSGSTGRPKGILGTHRPLSHFFQWHTLTFVLEETDRFSMLSGLSHDPLLRDIFTPLCLGATLCIPEQEQMLSPGQLSAWMNQQRVSVAHLTPALQQVLIIAISNDTQNLLPFLRYAFFGGESLTRQHVLGLKQLAPNVVCVNFYGATETPQAMGYSVVNTSQPAPIIPLGRGIQDVQLLILNPSAQLAGVGEVGEIHIRTPYLSRGYLQDDALTRERFLINPFTKDINDRIYKTGDLGRYLSNAEVEFLGRNDDQVKIRGFRIELSEIESALAGHPAVKQAVVSVWEADAGDKRLAAYVVPDPTYVLEISELRNFIKARLPDYMVPSSFMILDAVPLTPNGKVNRKALPTPNLDSNLRGTFVPPQSDVEKTIAEIWRDVLNLKQVGIHDNFFELGGHSLLATRVLSHIRESFQIDFPLRELFMAPTIAQSAEFIETVVWATRGQYVSSRVSNEENEEIDF